jgi:two-component system chemotaxis response regulator CheB
MIKVFIIDDSLSVRNSILKMLDTVENIKVIGEAANPVDAIDIFRKVGFPDIFILDIEMPKMDGLTFLRKINEQNPTPVIICSTLVSKGSFAAVDALRLGAVDIVLKPKINTKEFFIEQKQRFIESINIGVKSKVRYKQKLFQKDIKSKLDTKPSHKIVAIGSSTGGVQVIEDILTSIKPNHKGIVITQHMPEGFTASFSNRLNSLVSSVVVEATDGEIIEDNKVIIAKGGIHMEVVFDDGYYKVKLKDFPKVNSHKPSVNVLFGSIAKTNNKDTLAFILTGMGDDGAIGMKKLRDIGANTYSQDENSCVVYGMPKVAYGMKASQEELDILSIIEKIDSFR